MWLLTDKKVPRFKRMYEQAMGVVKNKIVKKIDEETFYFSQILDNGVDEHKMEVNNFILLFYFNFIFYLLIIFLFHFFNFFIYFNLFFNLIYFIIIFFF